MTNMKTFNNEIAKQALTNEENLIFNTLYNKVKKAEEVEKQKACNCFECLIDKSMKQLKEAIDSSSEEMTPELISHLIQSIFKSQGISAGLVVSIESDKHNTEKQKEEEKASLEEDLAALLSPLGIISFLSELSKINKQ